MAGPKATARLPALRRPVPASDLDVFLSALGALTWMLEWGCLPCLTTVPMGHFSGPGAPPS